MKIDPWHYPRTALAELIINMFESKLSSGLVFFAPRRMGKTEFLCKDILPLAENRDWKVFYFSFLDVGTEASIEFIKALSIFTKQTNSHSKIPKLFRKINKISGEVIGIKAGLEFNNKIEATDSMKEHMAYLASKFNILLLLDEVQTLAQHPENANFVAALRTCLDFHKDTIKVIFTGSSQEGLRSLFSQSKAPFFHFGQNLPFPELNRDFTDHLSRTFEEMTGRKVEADKLWELFEEMEKIPHLARALIERLALNPGLSLEEAKSQLVQMCSITEPV